MRGYVPAYDVVTPRDLSEALALLADSVSGAGAGAPLTALAGGTDLMVLLEAGLLPSGRLLNLWGLDELRGISITDEAITLGALTTYGELLRHATIAAELPMMHEAARLTAAPAIQNRGTLGGNVINASPAADTPPALLCYGAELELVSAAGRRRVPYDGFHTGYKQMDRRPDELLAAVIVPRRPGGPGAVHSYRKVGTRRAQAISKVVFAGLATVEGGVVTTCKLAYGSVAPTVLRARATERALLGGRPGPELAAAACAAAMAEVAPIDDIRSTGEYRRAVAGNLAAAFVTALAQA